MTLDDRTGFATRLMSMLTFYRQEVTAQTLEVWWALLSRSALTDVAGGRAACTASRSGNRSRNRKQGRDSPTTVDAHRGFDKKLS